MKFQLTIAIILFACSSFAQSNYTIFGGTNGKEGLNQGSTVLLQPNYQLQYISNDQLWVESAGLEGVFNARIRKFELSPSFEFVRQLSDELLRQFVRDITPDL